MINGYFTFSNNEIMGVSARNSAKKKNPRVISFELSDCESALDMFKSPQYVAALFNGIVEFPDFLTTFCKRNEAISQLKMTKQDAHTVNIKICIERWDF